MNPVRSFITGDDKCKEDKMMRKRETSSKAGTSNGSLAKEKTRRAEQRKLARGSAETLAAAVEGAEAVIAAKANEQGVLFGSVGPREIATNLREQGLEVADDVVVLAENIKQVGTHSVSLKFDKDLTATVNVVVVAEQEDENEPGN